jgi:hypothetical protein
MAAGKHIQQQAGNLSSRAARGQRSGKPKKRMEEANALVTEGATYEAAAEKVGYGAGGDALREALFRAGFPSPHKRKR